VNEPPPPEEPIDDLSLRTLLATARAEYLTARTRELLAEAHRLIDERKTPS